LSSASCWVTLSQLQRRHLADDPVKAASDAVGRHMAAAMDSGTSGEVVDFAQAKRGANLDDGSRQ
jgi:hypothetical protein